MPEAARGRAAALIITLSKESNLHLPKLRRRAGDFKPMMRDRYSAAHLVRADPIFSASILTGVA